MVPREVALLKEPPDSLRETPLFSAGSRPAGGAPLVKDDGYFMREALREARKAEAKGEVPVGAVVVRNEKIVGRGHNRNISHHDPSAHAEVIALRNAAKRIKNYRLPGCTLYVTIEPCPMCAGALVHARLDEVVFGTPDAKTGACGSVFNIVYNKKLNHRLKVTAGILERECSALIQKFFWKKRKKSKIKT